MSEAAKEMFGPAEVTTTDRDPRCRECGKMLARLVTRPWVIQCSRCKTTNSGTLPGQASPGATEAFLPTRRPKTTQRPARGDSRGNPKRLQQRPSI